jgi:EAL domain-containing protein (putative c-di-GMP-specific phosphodiesterase class I)
VPDTFATALLRGDLSIAYQPICPAWSSADKSDYFEALLRFRGGSPIAFLDLITTPEDHCKLDLWIAQQVCKLPNHFRYAINLSPPSLHNEQFLMLLLTSHHKFILEITEHHASELAQTDRLIEICRQFPVMLDDIGAAYSGLNRLCNFNFEGIKIDGHLVRQVEENFKARAIVGNLMRMAQDLGMCCVCEYVESLQIWQMLREIHTQYAPRLDLWVQGWAVGMPAPAPREQSYSPLRE